MEFALVGSVFFMLMFGLMVIAYWFHIYDTLTEAVRRGARIAAVCQVDATDIYRATVFAGNAADDDVGAQSATSSSLLPGLDSSMVSVEYVDPDPGNYAGYVKVAISGYTFNSNLPVLSQALTFPEISATASTESLGRFELDPTSADYSLRKCLMP